MEKSFIKGRGVRRLPLKDFSQNEENNNINSPESSDSRTFKMEINPDLDENLEHDSDYTSLSNDVWENIPSTSTSVDPKLFLVPRSISEGGQFSSGILSTLSDLEEDKNSLQGWQTFEEENRMKTASCNLDDEEHSKITNESADQFIVDDCVSFGSNIAASPSADFCRICHEMDQEEKLISPCFCKGSLSLVHTSCLQFWLAESDSSHCELCGFKYKTKRQPKYTLLGSVVAWFKSNRRERREVILDILGTVTSASMAGIGTYIGLLLAETLHIEEDVQNISMGALTGRMTALSVISLMATLDVACATWAAVRIQYHINSWYSWYRRHSEVILLQSPAENVAK